MYLKEFIKILILISTKSKNYKKINNKIYAKLSKILEKDKYKILLSKDLNTISQESKKFAEENDNEDSLLIIVGGDGSISEAANQIYNTKISLSFLPNGTGNDFSRTIYGKLNFDEILDKIEKIRIEKIDLLKINDKVSINVASFGYESIVLEKSLELKDKLSFMSKYSFILGVIFTLNKIQKYKFDYEIVLENGEIKKGSDEYMLTAICNGNYYGGGFNPAPFASISDGIIDLNTVDYVSIPRLIKVISKYKDKRHLSIKESNNYRVISGSFKRSDNSGFIGNIDGNIEKFDKIDFSILPKQINLAIFD